VPSFQESAFRVIRSKALVVHFEFGTKADPRPHKQAEAPDSDGSSDKVIEQPSPPAVGTAWLARELPCKPHAVRGRGLSSPAARICATKNVIADHANNPLPASLWTDIRPIGG